MKNCLDLWILAISSFDFSLAFALNRLTFSHIYKIKCAKPELDVNDFEGYASEGFDVILIHKAVHFSRISV